MSPLEDEIGALLGLPTHDAHTVRGLFSGTLKKKLGLKLGSAQEERGRVYRIVDAGETGERARGGR